MRIGFYHGYELTGSGSNEYTYYLAQSLVKAGCEVHLICREPRPDRIAFVTHAYAWTSSGEAQTLFCRNEQSPACYLHQLPNGSVKPVYLTDKQRAGNVKSFVTLTDEELAEYHRLCESALTQILSQYQLDVLHCNHLVYQPVAARQPCLATNTPLVIYPHGSSIEYTIKKDKRFERLALESIVDSTGLIIGNNEVLDRILGLYPEHRQTILDKSRIVGVGVDTSLFKPVDRSGREHSIDQLAHSVEGEGGKEPGLTQELCQRLDQGEIEATRSFWDRYDHSQPDSDLPDHLKRIPWDQKVLLFVGALTVGKGVQSLIVALSRVLDRHPNTHLVIVGAGAYREVLEALVYAISHSDRELLTRLCAKGNDLDRNDMTGPWEDVQCYLNDPSILDFVARNGNHLDRHVHFLGRMNHSQLRYLFPCADIAVFPSVVAEAYPLVVMEAMSNGVLPVVSNFSGFRDSIEELAPHLGESLVEKIKIPMKAEDRIGTLAENLSSLLANPDLDHIGSKLRQIAVENYDWKLRASQMVSAYRQLIQRSTLEP